MAKDVGEERLEEDKALVKTIAVASKGKPYRTDRDGAYPGSDGHQRGADTIVCSLHTYRSHHSLFASYSLYSNKNTMHCTKDLVSCGWVAHPL